MAAGVTLAGRAGCDEMAATAVEEVKGRDVSPTGAMLTDEGPQRLALEFLLT